MKRLVLPMWCSYPSRSGGIGWLGRGQTGVPPWCGGTIPPLHAVVIMLVALMRALDPLNGSSLSTRI